jgi:hypothetical protein
MGHEGCEFGTIEPPMSARDRWQNNERVLLGDIPVNFRRMAVVLRNSSNNLLMSPSRIARCARFQWSAS